MHIDDIFAAAQVADTFEINMELSRKFEIKILGKASQYLGVNITYLKDGSFLLDEENKIEETAKKFDLTHSNKPTYIPISLDCYNIDPERKLLSDMMCKK